MLTGESRKRPYFGCGGDASLTLKNIICINNSLNFALASILCRDASIGGSFSTSVLYETYKVTDIHNTSHPQDENAAKLLLRIQEPNLRSR